MIVKHKWPSAPIPPGEESIIEDCLYCGARRLRRESGNAISPGVPCDYSKIRDRALLSRLIDSHVTFFTVAPKREPFYRPRKKIAQVLPVVALLIFFVACSPATDPKGNPWPANAFLKRITARPSHRPHVKYEPDLSQQTVKP